MCSTDMYFVCTWTGPTQTTRDSIETYPILHCLSLLQSPPVISEGSPVGLVCVTRDLHFLSSRVLPP